MEEISKNLNNLKEENNINIENLETHVNDILERFKNIINDLKLNENSLSGSFSDVYNNFRSSIITRPDLENYKTIQKRIETNPQHYKMKIESIENYLNLIEKYPNFLKLEILNTDPDNWGGLHILFKEAEEELKKIKNSQKGSLDKRERTDLYIEKCYNWLDAKGDVGM